MSKKIPSYKLSEVWLNQLDFEKLLNNANKEGCTVNNWIQVAISEKLRTIEEIREFEYYKQHPDEVKKNSFIGMGESF